LKCCVATDFAGSRIPLVDFSLGYAVHSLPC
jgi:hypothetical protein